jgi:protein-S-isoprenylcysteine O-methyltransferase
MPKVMFLTHDYRHMCTLTKVWQDLVAYATQEDDSMILQQSRHLVVMYLTLLAAWIIGEIVVWRRSRGAVLPQDRGSGLRFIIVYFVGQIAGIVSLADFRWATFGSSATAYAGLALMVVGLLLRWWAVISLGRFFTFNLKVEPEQRVVDTGPYRHIRHPSYTGALVLMIGIGICFGNTISVLAIFVPMAVILLMRIRTEESLLTMKLGDDYRKYMQQTKRLVPGIY